MAVYDRQVILTPSEQSGILSAFQQLSISGTVTDAATGEALPGVNVVVTGTTTGTTTDINGKYIIEVPNASVSLQFSFIGYVNQQISLGGNTIINVALASDVTQLGEVVVTALGFKEDRDKVGSSSSKIAAEIISSSGETGLLNKMAGKASGVLVGKSSGSDPGGGSFIQIRGASTLSGDYQPLYIIDGVPMSNSIIGGTSYGGVIQQSRVNDINPEDIASIQVLKGASAAALWGSRAANGVVMITTKNGSFNEKMKISFKTTYSRDVINRYHEKQTNYGQGANGIYNPTSGSAWGDKIENRSGGEDVFNTTGQYFEGYQTGTRYYPLVQKNSKKTFENEQYNEIFRDGYFLDNNLSLSGGGATSNYMFSISDIYQQGVIRNSSDYRRSTVRLNLESKLSDILRLSTNATYAITKSNRVQRSNNAAGMMIGYYRMTTDYDITDYKGNYYSSPTASPVINRHRSYRNYLGSTTNPIYNNPLWTMYEQLNPNNVNRFILSSELAITPVKWFEFITRLGLDNYTDKRETYFPVYSAGYLNGSYDEQVIGENQVNWDVIGRAKHDFGNLLTSLIVGFNLNDRKYSSLSGNMVNFLIFNGPMSFSNAQAVNKNPFNSESNIRSARMYSVLGLTAYNSVFLNMSIAGESASTFGEASNNTFYYPSADIAWQFSKLSIFKNSPLLTFGKLRLAYGVAGVQPQPYRTETLFTAGNSLYGNGAYLQSSNGGNDQLSPEKKTEYEIGLDLRFFNNSFRADITYYQNYVEDLLLSVPVPYSTGYSTFYQNIGAMENKGLEIDLNYDILKKEDLFVTLNANFSQNRNLVTDLADASRVFVGGVGGFMGEYAVEGEPVGVFMGGHYSRDNDGKILFDANGFPLVDGTEAIIGDPNPDWRGGLGGEAKYKNFSLSVIFETFQGGDFYDGTRSVMYTHGTHPDVGNEVTTDIDLRNFKGVLIPAGSTVRGNVMDLGAGPVLLDESYYTTQGGGFGSLKEQCKHPAYYRLTGS
ncbi:MAG: SusC/RagA family TonB-linked outer membrane protein [Bacteroidetes bacterium GWA2_40_15]|nr:MAG: SusC/RagA family TonB-linked outer membrane protein [Bacteroidetes bacterium GWA2_40_15]OFX99054.1 MAG: SusC/RagA family TonB-linked outer membrane protein [Bacteroidetes bacterium GWC2_40_22]